MQDLNASSSSSSSSSIIPGVGRIETNQNVGISIGVELRATLDICELSDPDAVGGVELLGEELSTRV